MVTAFVPRGGPAVRDKKIRLSGGLNESVSSMDLKPGELIESLNYLEVEGEDYGYMSVGGYEVYDGTPLASEVPYIFDPDTGAYDDTDREARRAAITPVPGEGSLNGLHWYNNALYGLRDELTISDNATLHVATSSGWSELSMPPGAVKKGGSCQWANARFSKYPTAGSGGYPPVMTNIECFFMVDGVSRPISYDGTTVRELSDVNLPCDPAFTPAPIYPYLITAFDQRLWLAFPGGWLFYSALGNPGDWSGVSGANALPMGSEIRSIYQGTANTLIVFTDDTIRVITPTEPGSSYDYRNEPLTDQQGAFKNSPQRIVGDVLFINAQGPSTLSTTDKYGDFEASSLSKKLHKTFYRNKTKFLCSVVDRRFNQYRAFFEGGIGLCYTFRGDRLKGATVFKYVNTVVHVTEGKDAEGTQVKFFSSDDVGGYVYKMDSGTSFNGSAIQTSLTTSYHDYGYDNIKQFINLTIEASIPRHLIIKILPSFNYSNPDTPRGAELTPESGGSQGGIWDVSKWNEFTWGGSFIETPASMIDGYGKNLAISFYTLDKYRPQHVLHNLTVSYKVLGKVF